MVRQNFFGTPNSTLSAVIGFGIMHMEQYHFVKSLGSEMASSMKADIRKRYMPRMLLELADVTLANNWKHAVGDAMTRELEMDVLIALPERVSRLRLGARDIPKNTQ